MSTAETGVAAATAQSTPEWWGTYEIPDTEAGHWRIGPLDIWMRRRPREWRLAIERHGDTLDQSLTIECPVDGDELPPAPEVTRFATRTTVPRLRLTPVLAERPVVTRPEDPFHVLAHDEARFFVSTSVVVRLATTDDRQLTEIPTVRMSDTWFSPSTRYGELCYASRTNARLDLATLPLRHHRAVTQVTIRNAADDALLLERLKLPVPHLSLFWAEGESLWTQAIVVERESDGHLANVRLDEDPGAGAAAATPLGEARIENRGNVFSRTIGALLG